DLVDSVSAGKFPKVPVEGCTDAVGKCSALVQQLLDNVVGALYGLSEIILQYNLEYEKEGLVMDLPGSQLARTYQARREPEAHTAAGFV
ncbi:unnamed protein product, partial [Discosporangium mesarthrocarpum]